MAVEKSCKTKLVHVIPFDDDVASVIVEPATKRLKTGTRTSENPSLTSLEQEGLQALLTLSAPAKGLLMEVDHGQQRDVIQSRKPLKGDVPTIVSQIKCSTKTPDPAGSNSGTSSSNRSNCRQGVIMKQPLLPPPPSRYLGRPLAPPLSLPRIPYGCIFAKRDTTNNDPHIQTNEDVFIKDGKRDHSKMI